MMQRATLTIITLLFCKTFLFGQQESYSETKTHLFWHADRSLQYSDFKGSGSRFTKHNQYCKDYNWCVMAFLGIYAQLDIPKNEKHRGKMLEIAYFVPVFDKTASYILKKDSAGVKQQQIIYDIYELSARFARKKLQQCRDSLTGYGSATLLFKTVEMDATEYRNEMITDYTQALYLYKLEGAYRYWREKIDTILKQTERFATTNDDRKRAMTQKPLSKKYEPSKKFIGDIHSENRAF